MSESMRKKLPMALGGIAVLVIAGRLFFGGGDDASLTSSDPVKRLVAMESLLKENTDAARARLRSMTQDDDPRVIMQSLRGMGINRDEANRRQLETFAFESPRPEYRREALAALGQYQNVSVSHFTQVLAGDRDPQARAGAAQALARRADRSTIPAMYKALSDPDARVRVWAITGIKEITFITFIYEAALPPAEQREVIVQIGQWLQKNGYM